MSFLYKGTNIQNIISNGTNTSDNNHGYNGFPGKYENNLDNFERCSDFGYSYQGSNLSSNRRAFYTEHNNDSNIVKPSGCKAIRVYAVGGGGGGGGGGGVIVGDHTNSGGGGGGSGAPGEIIYSNVISIASINNLGINIGKGGNGGSTGNINSTTQRDSGNSGSSGNSTTISYGSDSVTAQGGNGGSHGNNANGQNSSLGAGGDGGTNSRNSNNTIIMTKIGVSGASGGNTINRTQNGNDSWVYEIEHPEYVNYTEHNTNVFNDSVTSIIAQLSAQNQSNILAAAGNIGGKGAERYTLNDNNNYVSSNSKVDLNQVGYGGAGGRGESSFHGQISNITNTIGLVYIDTDTGWMTQTLQNSGESGGNGYARIYYLFE
jgi:hypothetical protein